MKDGTKVGRIEKPSNRTEHHDALVAACDPRLKAAAVVGAKQVICFSGNRDGISDDQGLDRCATGLEHLLPLAEKLGITFVMKLLNSKVRHKDHMCDHTAWGVELCKRFGSANFKLIYDIYHIPIMKGDVISNIRAEHPFIPHYHTGGVPGSNEIDESQ